jgi:hypothetical protein
MNYKQALVWLDQACWMSPDPTDVIHEVDAADLQPAYKLAFENILLCLAKLGRIPEATDRVVEYCQVFGRVPSYESNVLLEAGIDPDCLYVQSRISASKDESGAQRSSLK